MAALSGKHALVFSDGEDVQEFTEWELEYGAATEEYFSRHGGGAAETVDGAESGSGSITMNVDPDQPLSSILRTGQLKTLQLFHTPGGALVASGDGRIGKPKMGANRDGKVQQVTVPFTCHGFWTGPGIS